MGPQTRLQDGYNHHMAPPPTSRQTTGDAPPDAGSGSDHSSQPDPAISQVSGGKHRHRPTRVSSAWVSLAAGIVLLVIVLVFILENLKTVQVGFFGATWRVPLAIDLLLAAVLGALIVFTAGSLRIVQLRRAIRRKSDSKPA